MSADLSVFQFDGADVRTVIVDGEPWWIGNDVARVLGYANPAAAIAKHTKGVAKRYPLSTAGGVQEFRVLSEPDMLRLVVASNLPSADRFERWVFEDVLPTIRRTGNYTAAPALPQNYSAALRELAAEVEQREALQAKVAADAPKVLFADAVATSDTDILVGDLAKILRGNGVPLGANRLFELMRDEGYLIRRRGTDWNMPTQRSMELGLFRVKETAVTHSDGHVTVSKTPKVTGKGQQYFVERYATRFLSTAVEVAS